MSIKSVLIDGLRYLILPKRFTSINSYLLELSISKILANYIKYNRQYSVKSDLPDCENSNQRCIHYSKINHKSENVILSTYFSSKEDPQSQTFVEKNHFLYIKDWYESVVNNNLYAIIFHDELSNEFIEEYSCQNIQFIKVNLGHLSLNDERFIIYKYFLKYEGAGFKKVILTDINDVIFNSDPFKFIEKDNIYIGFDSFYKPISSLWFRTKMASYIKESNEIIDKKLLISPFVNAGVIGGDIKTILNLLNDISSKLDKIKSKSNYNMVIVNISIYYKYNKGNKFIVSTRLTPHRKAKMKGENIFIGYPFLSKFKYNDYSVGSLIKHK